MSNEQTPDESPLTLDAQEQNLLRTLRKNPMLADQFQIIAQRFEQEIADGMDAHEAEVSMISSC